MKTLFIILLAFFIALSLVPIYIIFILIGNLKWHILKEIYKEWIRK
jgi:hypothetical protein